MFVHQMSNCICSTGDFFTFCHSHWCTGKYSTKKEVGLTKMIILILVCPKKVYWKQLLYQMSFVNVYRGSKFYEV